MSKFNTLCKNLLNEDLDPMNQTVRMLEKLWKQGRIYLVENNNEGVFQLALRGGSEPDPANDHVWDLEVVEYP